jgi:DNA-binding transcriptional ArsR family regulator
MSQWLHEASQRIASILQDLGPVKTLVASVITSIVALASVRKWLLAKHDGEILRILRESRRTAQVNMRPGQHAAFFPFAFQEIVKDAKRSERSVRRSLRRLEDRGEVHEVRDGWNLGPRPEPMTVTQLIAQHAGPSRWDNHWNNRRW